MKKIVSIICIITALAALLTACGETFTCDICKQEKSGTKHNDTYLGQEVVACDDCHDVIDAAADAADAAADAADALSDLVG